MTEQNNMTDNMVNDQQHEEVDYADPESPTLAIRRLASPTTGQTERPTDVHSIELADIIDKPLPRKHINYPFSLQPRHETATCKTTMRL